MGLLTLLVALPFLGAIATMLTPRQYDRAIKGIGMATGLLTLALSIGIWFAYDQKAAGFQLQDDAEWLPSLGIRFHLGVDGISVVLLLLTGVVIFCGALVSWNVADRAKEFFALLLVLVGGVFGVFAALDLFFFFFFYEVAVLPMYLLIAVWGSTRKEYAAMKLTLYLVAGSVLVWVALLAMFVQGGSRSFGLDYLQGIDFSPDFQRLFFPFLAIGFGVLAGLWPFHTWSPDGHVAAPTAVSMLHAGVLMKLGAYGILRIGVFLLPEGARFWMPYLILLGTVNVIYGALSALAQKDLKFVIGYSSVSHMGYVIMGLATLTVAGLDGAVLQMFSHGIMTALFFAMVGIIYGHAHTREIAAFSGLGRQMPIVSVLFIIAGLASLGLPGLSGFVAEFLIFVGTFQTYPWLGVVGIIGVAITATYVLRLIGRVFLGPLDPRWQDLQDAVPIEALAGGILVFCLFLIGVYPGPMVDLIRSSVEPILARVGG